MLTINEIIRERHSAKVKKIEALFLTDLFGEILDSASTGRKKHRCPVLFIS